MTIAKPNRDMRRRPVTVLILVSIAEFLAMSMWFSFSAIKPLIADQWAISNTDAGLILAAFQTGYIVGVPAFGYLADAPWHVMASSASSRCGGHKQRTHLD